mmetsp:Transcript_17261/g.37253  ORF Transcript_17261/g.37253 Transcript_17261/m.37253 type:complete len:244 (-) Transcript_17261:2828-3559(-)
MLSQLFSRNGLPLLSRKGISPAAARKASAMPRSPVGSTQEVGWKGAPLKLASLMHFRMRKPLAMASARPFLFCTSLGFPFFSEALIFCFFVMRSISLSFFSCSRALLFLRASNSRFSRFSSSSSCLSSFLVSSLGEDFGTVLAFFAFSFSFSFSFSFTIFSFLTFFSESTLAFAFFLPSTLKSRSPSEASNSFNSSMSDSLVISMFSSISSASSSDWQRISNEYPGSLKSSSSSDGSPHVLLS